MKQVIINIPDHKYLAFIELIKTRFADIQIKEKDTSDKVEDNPRDGSSYETMLLSEKSLAKDWLLPEEDEAWKDL